MIHKILISLLTILIGIVLLPIIIFNIELGKSNYETISFDITNVEGDITSNLSFTQLNKILSNKTYFVDANDLILKNSDIDTYTDFYVDDPIIYEAEVLTNVKITFADNPINIHAGDIMVFNRTIATYNNISYYEVYRNDMNIDPIIWGFKSSSGGHSVYINGEGFLLEGGSWNSHSFQPAFTNEYLDWSFSGNVGTLQFLKDWPVSLDGIYSSSKPTVMKRGWANSTNISMFTSFTLTIPISNLELQYTTTTLSINVADLTVNSNSELKEGIQTIILTFNKPVNNTIVMILDILPLIFALIVISGSVIYIKFYK